MALNQYHSGNATLVMLLVISWLAAVGSALGVVYSTFESRKAVQNLELLRKEAAGLRVMSGNLMLEKSTWASYARVEEKAKDELQMLVPNGEQTVLVFKK